ncbi:hypothetical protein [Vibrio phage vB_VpaP_G1]|uniref:Uncharacterized protein n=1 Tax=Vibrio phage vB_VpaP_G1 TaxID=2862773 RepID=A0AAE8BLI7_9CAUD|nr:hypothetical protein PP280_gp44 [Vibrio phage vB_VpaP_G1]QYW05844.1 hypothetical protein [Vibrio phage vB_VpaP_G1]
MSNYKSALAQIIRQDTERVMDNLCSSNCVGVACASCPAYSEETMLAFADELVDEGDE